MSSASKGNPLFVDLQVGEIFTAAGTAFTKLGELTMQLHTSSVGGSTKWTEEDIQLMHNCLTKFANEIDEITSRVKLRTMAHLNASIKKKEYEEAGFNPPPLKSSHHHHITSPTSSTPHSHSGSHKGNRRTGKKFSGSSHPHPTHLQGPIGASIPPAPHSQDLTLNMLNASDEHNELKMDYDTGPGAS